MGGAWGVDRSAQGVMAHVSFSLCISMSLLVSPSVSHSVSECFAWPFIIENTCDCMDTSTPE